MKNKWTIGTRGSKLALKQTDILIGRLRVLYPDHEFVVKTIKTTGDTVWDKPLHQIGGKGLFVKEIEEKLIDGEIDMAVHSVKDLPAELEKGLELAAVLEREDPRDAFISETYEKLSDIKGSARIGTGSLRRKAQLLHFNSSLQIVPIRGNIDTRLRKLRTEGLDGVILACAGVKRMGLEAAIKEMVPYEIAIPSCGQGAIGIETRNSEARDLLGPLNDTKTFQEVAIERKLLKLIGGGCHLPLGIHADVSGDNVSLWVSMGKETGELFLHKKYESPMGSIDELIDQVYSRLQPHLS